MNYNFDNNFINIIAFLHKIIISTQNKYMIIIIKHYIIYGFAGLLLEVLWTGVGSLFNGDKKLQCHTFLWMFFIYGSAVIFEPVHEFIRNFGFVYRGFIWAALIFAIEYLSGSLLDKTIGNCPWDYTAEGVITIKGYIRLDYLPVWFAAGMFFERLHDFLAASGV